MENIEQLVRQLDRHPRGAMIEIRDLCDGSRHEWNWAHTVNVYDIDGNNVDAYSVGDFANNRATIEEFLAGVLSHLPSHTMTDPDVAEVAER